MKLQIYFVDASSNDPVQLHKQSLGHGSSTSPSISASGLKILGDEFVQTLATALGQRDFENTTQRSKWVAEQLGMSERQVQRWSIGKSSMREDKLVTIIDTLRQKGVSDDHVSAVKIAFGRCRSARISQGEGLVDRPISDCDVLLQRLQNRLNELLATVDVQQINQPKPPAANPCVPLIILYKQQGDRPT